MGCQGCRRPVAPFGKESRITRAPIATITMTDQEKANTVGEPNSSQAPAQQPEKIAPVSNQDQQTDQEALSATITYLEGLPTGVAMESAIENIQAWQQRLRDAGKPELNG